VFVKTGRKGGEISRRGGRGNLSDGGGGSRGKLSLSQGCGTHFICSQGKENENERGGVEGARQLGAKKPWKQYARGEKDIIRSQSSAERTGRPTGEKAM